MKKLRFIAALTISLAACVAATTPAGAEVPYLRLTILQGTPGVWELRVY